MKTLKITITLFFTLIITLSLDAQFKLNASGKVSIGNYSPSASYNLYTGTARFLDNVYFQSGNLGINTSPSSSYSMRVWCSPPLLFEAYSYYPDIIVSDEANSIHIYPSSNNSCYLGKSDRRFNTIYCVNLSTSSDKRLKENIRDIDNALEIVLNLKGVKYDVKKEFLLDEENILIKGMVEKIEEERKDHYGFLAQDVEPVYKFAVTYDDSLDIYGIDYTKFVPILVEAIKELKAEVEILKQELENEKITDIQPKSTNLEESSNLNFDSEIQPFLGNNIPNPFDQATEIEFYLPQEISNADFYIYDLQGKQIMKFEVVEREYGSITIQGSQLMPGMYYYSLIADSRVIGTKQMILTD